jgi:hypothetical protein
MTDDFEVHWGQERSCLQGCAPGQFRLKTDVDDENGGMALLGGLVCNNGICRGKKDLAGASSTCLWRCIFQG